VSQRALSQVELLNQQIAALRNQIAALESALDVSEQRDVEANAKIADLGRRLNVALAQRVQELNRYRSDFFGRLREILSDRENIRIVGDRFVFQSEVLFPSGSEIINPAGREEMQKLASAILELQREIPPEIAWVLRVDGHTDNIPLSGTGRFRDNWELSSARATAVVKYLIENGVPPERLVAAGFGEFQPLDTADTPEARNRNRRIELKLTER
jgi:chemotaxis protein MotB